MAEKIISNNSEFLKISEIAEYLNVCKPVIRSEIAKGKLPAFQIGGLILIKKADFENYLESVKVKSETFKAEENEEVKIEDAE